jgi:carboxyl-terminal processing protease
MTYFNKNLFFLIIPLLFLFISCEEDEVNDLTTEKEEFYELMKQGYYWNDFIPDIRPSSYSSLAEIMDVIRYDELDRWSFVTEWDAFWAYINNSEYVGYGFGSKYDQLGNLYITFLYNSVDLYEKGVRRGWILQAVNGTALVPGSNFNQIFGPDEVGVSNSFRFLNPEGETVNITSQKEVVKMNTVLHSEIIVSGDKNIGYLVLQGFQGTTSADIKAIFQKFKQEDVNELILDMRYNGGGLTSVARELASLIGGPSLVGKPFTNYEYNANLADEYNKTDEFTNEPNNLALNRLVTICTDATASASELVINGLDPFIDLYIVGADTYGKPMGANIQKFRENWAVVPITFKTTNADGIGEYFDGLPVDIPANDDIDKDFGDPEEASLKQALAFILSGSVKSQEVVEPIPFEQPLEGKWGLRRMIGAF